MIFIGQRHMETFREEQVPFVEAINWVCANVQGDHDWVSEFSQVMRENEVLGDLDCDIEVPCNVQRGVLWESALAILIDVLLDDGCMLHMYNKVIDMAWKLPSRSPSRRCTHQNDSS